MISERQKQYEADFSALYKKLSIRYNKPDPDWVYFYVQGFLASIYAEEPSDLDLMAQCAWRGGYSDRHRCDYEPY